MDNMIIVEDSDPKGVIVNPSYVDIKDTKEIRIATIGNVDAGKSTLTSVLVNGIPDDGRGSARLRVMKQKHEKESGRSSTISNHFIRGPHPDMPNTEVIIDFRDLAGHGKYYRTTVKGMCRPLDYAMLVIATNDGIGETTRDKITKENMAKEHFSIALNLRIPMFIVVTKIDMAQDGMLEMTRNQINKFLNPSYKKKPTTDGHGNKHIHTHKHKQTLSQRQPLFMSSNEKDYAIKLAMLRKAYDCGDYHAYIPVFEVSSKPNLNMDGIDKGDIGIKTGREVGIDKCQGIPELLDFIMRLPVYQNYKYLVEKPAAFFIENEYLVKGVGLVVCGIMLTGEIKKGDHLRLGPFYDKFHNIVVRNIHNNFREDVPSISAGFSGCLAIRVEGTTKVTRKMIRAGMRIVAPGAEECLYWYFKAKILVQKHPTSIHKGYIAFIHCGAVNQPAALVSMDKKDNTLRLGDRAEVVFKFQRRPEFIQPGMRLLFREGLTKGVGEVLEIYGEDYNEDE